MSKNKEDIKSSIDRLKETAFLLNERLLVAEERYRAAELTLQKIKSTASNEIQNAYKNGYNKALADMQASSGGFTVANENDNIKKLALKTD